MKAAKDASEEIFADYAAKDPSYRAIYEPWRKARGEAYSWFGTAERAYAQFAFKSGAG
jgi:TRAP-type mannitol/chloroaromatic compound transport system substrate-binding protein